jgi:hypothetical protein
MLISLLGTCLAAITLDGTLETIEDVEAVWQLPATTPSNIMLLAHGCNHGSIDFWPRSPKCAQCIGLPEEMRIVSTALERGWAVVAFSSIDRQFRRCWNFHEDGPRVTRALGAFRKQHWGLEKAAVTALGASSGGAFVLQLPQLLPLKAVVSQIMAIPPQARSPRLSLAPARPRAGRRVADQGPAAAGPPPKLAASSVARGHAGRLQLCGVCCRRCCAPLPTRTRRRSSCTCRATSTPRPLHSTA